MGSLHPGRRLLHATLRGTDNQIDLVVAALAIAWEDLGAVDVEHCLRHLDNLAAMARAQIALLRSTSERIDAIVDYLHRVEGFAGNQHDYDDPANSYLPLVLERRTGLPITLSLLALHVGIQAGLPFEPAGLPGHFMLRCATPEGMRFVDLFYGRVLDAAACRAFLQHRLGHLIADPERFPTPSCRQVLARLLRNLKGSYARREDDIRALAATERILLMEPDASEDVRDCGLLRARIGDLHRALLDLDHYAEMEPLAPDIERVRKRARVLAAAVGQRN